MLPTLPRASPVTAPSIESVTPAFPALILPTTKLPLLRVVIAIAPWVKISAARTVPPAVTERLPVPRSIFVRTMPSLSTTVISSPPVTEAIKTLTSLTTSIGPTTLMSRVSPTTAPPLFVDTEAPASVTSPREPASRSAMVIAPLFAVSVTSLASRLRSDSTRVTAISPSAVTAIEPSPVVTPRSSTAAPRVAFRSPEPIIAASSELRRLPDVMVRWELIPCWAFGPTVKNASSPVSRVLIPPPAIKVISPAPASIAVTVICPAPAPRSILASVVVMELPLMVPCEVRITALVETIAPISTLLAKSNETELPLSSAIVGMSISRSRLRFVPPPILPTASNAPVAARTSTSTSNASASRISRPA